MLKIGWAEKPLTPPNQRIYLAGQFYERISEEMLSPVTVTAMAIETETDAAVFCACDLVNTSVSLLKKVRENLKGTTLPLDKIIVSATHTHTSVQYADSGEDNGVTLDILQKYLPRMEKEGKAPIPENVWLPEEAFFFLAEQIACAAQLAWENRKSALYATGFGRAAVGLCRRVCYDDGSAKMWGDTNTPNFTELESGSDTGIELMYLFDAEKNLTGVVANLACPAQVMGQRSYISADFWGETKRLLREKFGENVYLLSLCAPAGDQCPRDMIRWVNPETPIRDPNIARETYIERDADPSMFDKSGCCLAGRRIANEIFWAYEDITEYKKESPFFHKVFYVDLPIRRVTPSEYEDAEREIIRFAKEKKGTSSFKDNAEMHVYAGTMARYELQKMQDIRTVEIHVLRLGEIAIATNPFELFLNYGNQIRGRSLARQTFLIQLACGAEGYLPTEKAEEGGHYSAYVSSGITGHEGGNLLVRKTISEINAMWK